MDAPEPFAPDDSRLLDELSDLLRDLTDGTPDVPDIAEAPSVTAASIPLSPPTGAPEATSSPTPQSDDSGHVVTGGGPVLLPESSVFRSARAADEHLPSLADMVRRLNARIAEVRAAPAGAFAAAAGQRYLTCSVAGRRYAVPLDNVTEVARVPGYTPLPRVPDWLLGLANLRGHVLSLIDLARFLGGVRSDGISGRLVVVRPTGGEVLGGLVVDEVHRIRDLGPGTIRPLSDPGLPGGRFLCGECDDGPARAAVFDVDRLLLSEEMQRFAA